MKKTNLKIRIASVFLALTVVLSTLPMTVFAADPGAVSTSVADPKTLSNWKNWFTTDSTRAAGGVFLDKSVYTASEAKTDNYFHDIQNKLNFGADTFGNENFMVALSALGSNSEILGYSHTPVDTVIVLDASTSMGTGSASSTAIDDMVAGANEAIKRLLSLNNYNRVGVVIYNGNSSVLLPIERYGVKNGNKVDYNANILQYVRSNSQNYIYIAENVVDSKGSVARTSVRQAQGTYTQGGIYAAAQEFLKMDTVIADEKIQGGTKRQPILVLMSDGQPSYRTKTSSNTTVDKYNAATNANCDNSNFREDEITAFSTMLTAAWAEGEITHHYGTDALFYTLGYNLDAGHDYAHNVLDPLNPNNEKYRVFKGFADQYLALSKGSTKQMTGGSSSFRVQRMSEPTRVKSLDYVDRYWQTARASDLTAAFDSIVDEIVIQSRYYSTLVSSNQHHQDGFVSFTDEIGTHMEVKKMLGFYIGEGKLVSGGMFAEFVTTGKVSHVGENYTEEALKGFESEVLNALSERFGIDVSTAYTLLNTAEEKGYIRYNNADDFSNYLAWYADSQNTYLAPYTGAKTPTTIGTKTPKYLVRSYVYMGDVTQNHVETSMMYALVRIREDLETGRQIVDLNVPAALLPMVTYTVSVEGDTLREDNILDLSCSQKYPISLLYEVGLNDEITPYNLADKMQGQDFRRNKDGSYSFFTNRWRDAQGAAFTIPEDPDPHVFNHGVMNTTVAQFIPSLENERYYYTHNTAILDGNYQPYTGAVRPQGKGYFTEHTWIEKNGNTATLKKAYNPVSPALLSDTESVTQLSGKSGWYALKHSPEFYFGEEVHGEQAHAHKTENKTVTLLWSDYPHIAHHESEGHNGYHMLDYLGNNGRITATPATGIRLTKAVDTVVPGAPTTFEFEIELKGNQLPGAYPVYIERADGTVQNATVNAVGGVLSVRIAAGDTAYITGIPNGAEYTVTEKFVREYTPSSTNATGTVSALALKDVHFVNSPRGFGSLLVSKDVRHPFEAADVPAALGDVEFDITVTFDGAAEELKEIVKPDGTKNTAGETTFNLTLKDGTDALFTSIPEGVTYDVREPSTPNGFKLSKNDSKDLNGAIVKDQQAHAAVINAYLPEGVSPKIRLTGEKTFRGKTDWTEEFSVAVQQVHLGGEGAVNIGKPKTIGVMKKDSGYDFDFATEFFYNFAGVYSYIVYEEVPQAPIVDVAYDKSFAIFSVTVTDKDVDGQLEIDNVVVHRQTAALSGDAQNGYEIKKDFTNVYQADQIEFVVQKTVNGLHDHAHDSGILFGLFAGNTAQYEGASAVPEFYAMTDEDGQAHFFINVLKSEYATAKTYYLREMTLPIEESVTGMTYDVSWKYTVTIHWPDSAAAPNVTFKTIAGADVAADSLVINNQYDPTNLPDVRVRLRGMKTLNGSTMLGGREFTFKLYKTDATFIPNTEELQSFRLHLTNEIELQDLRFNTAGTHYFKVVEVAENNQNGITYDPTEYHITAKVVKVYDDNHRSILSLDPQHGGSLVIHKTGGGTVEADEIDFDNQYHINGKESVAIGGKKTLTGRDLIAGEFSFGLFEAGATQPLYTVSNRLDGTFAFPELSYSVVNATEYDETFVYEIREIVPDANDTKGVDYDDTVYTVTVRLEDNGAGGLKKTVTLGTTPVNGAVSVAFENTYKRADTEISFGGQKTLEGRDLEENEFIFDLFETDRDFAIKDVTKPIGFAKNGADGRYKITLSYDGDDQNVQGLHYYVLKEREPSEKFGVAYDPTRYDITVAVVDNGHGELEASVMDIFCPFNDGVFTAETLDFVNRYKATPTAFTVAGTKTLSGREMEDGEFTFVLADRDGTALQTAAVEDGKFAFAPLAIEQAGVFTYFVSEQKGEDQNVTYDTAVYTVELTVEDDGRGNLSVREKFFDQAGDEVSAIAFKNVYEEPKPEPTPDPKPEQPKAPESPKTGGSAMFRLLLALLFVSGGALGAAVIGLCRKKSGN